MPWMRCPSFSARTLTVADSALNFLETPKNVIADDQVTVTMKTNKRQSLASPMRSDIINTFARYGCNVAGCRHAGLDGC